jgi:hypothetical protein
MNTTQTLPPGMILHCGAEVANRSNLNAIETPASTESWFPLPHADLLESVEAQLQETGFVIEAETHALSKKGARYFGLLQVTLPSRSREDFKWIVALRNSHDKTFPAGLVAGSRVLVCDNLAFSGEVTLSRKHTRFASRDLPGLTARAIGKLSQSLIGMDNRLDAYRSHDISTRSAHDLLIRCVDAEAFPVTQLPAVLKEWREPKHEAFESKNAWSLFNAVTEIAYKGKNPAINLKRGEALHGVFDSLVLAG